MIKLFEEYNQYYTEISRHDYLEPKFISAFTSSALSKSVFFTQNELDTILKFFKQPPTMDLTRKYSISFRGNKVPSLSDGKIEISKYEDDWFYVIFVESSRAVKYVKYYKCDQFDGLMDFLNTNIKSVFNLSFMESYNERKIDSHSYYSTIPESEYDNMIGFDGEYGYGYDLEFVDNNYVKFTDIELERIRILINKCRVDRGLTPSPVSINKLVIFGSRTSRYIEVVFRIDDKMPSHTMYITKLKDEWYYLIIGGIFYRCDQFEGLLKCIEDNI